MKIECQEEIMEYILQKRAGGVRRFHTRNRRLLQFIIFCAIFTYFLQGGLFRTFSYIACRFGGDADESTRRELVQIQVLFRHGHRSPFYIYKTDPNPAEFWTTLGLGQLTQLGKLQHYLVGQHLRQFYAGFLSSNAQEVHCLSSGAKRCLFAAYAQLAGMYPPSEDKMIDGQLSWQPVPVEHNPEYRDLYLQSSPNCPLAEDERKKIFAQEGAEYVAKSKHLYDFWANKSGEAMNHYDDAGGLFKTLAVEKTYNLTIPDWAQETWEDLREQADKCYSFHFKTKLLQRLRAGPLLGRMLNVWKSKIANIEKRKKVYLYSGHGSNMAAVLQALHIFNGRAPPYSSFLTFELYREGGQEGGHTVRILYSNNTNPEREIRPPHVLVLPDCTEYCPVEFLEGSIEGLVPEDWQAECESNGKKFRRKDFKIIP